MSKVKQYRNKPVVIEAIQFTGENEAEIWDFVGKRLQKYAPPSGAIRDHDLPHSSWQLEIPTLEGNMRADRMDYIIKGVSGEYYPCKPDIFNLTYELV